MGKKGAKGMVSQEEKCTPAISQVRLPLFPSLWLCLWGWGEGLLSICRLTLLPRACLLIAQLRLLE